MWPLWPSHTATAHGERCHKFGPLCGFTQSNTSSTGLQEVVWTDKTRADMSKSTYTTSNYASAQCKLPCLTELLSAAKWVSCAAACPRAPFPSLTPHRQCGLFVQGQQPSAELLDRRGEASARSNSCIMVVMRMVERLTDLVQGRLHMQPWSGEQLSKQQVSYKC